MPESAEASVINSFSRRTDGLEVNTIDGGFMVYHSERNRAHYLNHTAVPVPELSNGRDSAEKIAGLVQEAFGLAEAPDSEVREIVAGMESWALINVN